MNESHESIAMLGTSADPPTCGHKVLLEGLLKIFPKVVTWASDNPMKKHGTSLENRHSLLQILVNEIDNPNLELIQVLSNPLTIKTLEIAAKRWPKAELIFVVGSDLAKQVPRWFKSHSLLKKARLAIAPRAGWPINKVDIDNLKSLGASIEILPLEIPKTASSAIRKKLISSQIPKSILKIIITKNLYGITSNNL